jgi:hypothetical protein
MLPLRIDVLATSAHAGGRAACSAAESLPLIAHPLAACESARQLKHALELMVAAGRKPLPQAVVAFEGFADRRQFRLVSFNCCGEDVFEAVIVNPREILTQDRRGKFIRR